LNQIHSNTKFEQNFNHINLNQNLKWLLFEIILNELQQRTVQLGYIGANATVAYWATNTARWPNLVAFGQPMLVEHGQCVLSMHGARSPPWSTASARGTARGSTTWWRVISDEVFGSSHYYKTRF
jgi:hypothetical protein